MDLHFVIPPDYAGYLNDLDGQVVGDTYPHWVGGRFNWAAQSYLHLRKHFENVSIGLQPKPSIVNFGHCMAWRELGPRQGEYRVSVRADYPRLFDVDFEILQNPSVSLNPTQIYLPYWPVPGIIPRDSKRIAVSRIAYAGRIGNRNLVDPIKRRADGGAFQGLEFIVLPPERWHDLSQIDLLVAIRSFGRQTHDSKPPSKLFNSWIAGIPLIGGYDSAFSAIAEPGVEYIRVETQAELEEAVAALRNDRVLYDRIVAAGAKRRGEYTHEAVAKVWADTIKSAIATDFEHWQEEGGAGSRQLVSRGLDHGRAAFSHFKARLKGW